MTDADALAFINSLEPGDTLDGAPAANDGKQTRKKKKKKKKVTQSTTKRGLCVAARKALKAKQKRELELETAQKERAAAEALIREQEAKEAAQKKERENRAKKKKATNLRKKKTKAKSAHNKRRLRLLANSNPAAKPITSPLCSPLVRPAPDDMPPLGLADEISLPHPASSNPPSGSHKISVTPAAAALQPSVSTTIRDGDKRSPVICILGHVDVGKTKLLDFIRGSNVFASEAGSITQQIGATIVARETIHALGAREDPARPTVGGLLMIDTPGHEMFSNLRHRGSSLCDLAVVVVDLLHGIERQTLESLSLLRRRSRSTGVLATKTPFVLALNKVDRVYDWSPARKGEYFADTLKRQSESTLSHLHTLVETVQGQLWDQLRIRAQVPYEGMPSAARFPPDEQSVHVVAVPTSAVGGDGVGELLQSLRQGLLWVCGLCRPQGVGCQAALLEATSSLGEKLKFQSNLIECQVMEVNAGECGLGTTLDVILKNGVLSQGNKVAVCGLNGPIITNVRALMVSGAKGRLVKQRQVRGTIGVKIVAPKLDQAMCGAPLFVIPKNNKREEREVLEHLSLFLEKKLQSQSEALTRRTDGVHVQASTIGSLEAILRLFKERLPNIPVATTGIGPLSKKDVKAALTMRKKFELRESGAAGSEELPASVWGCVLVFDVKVDASTSKLAKELEVKILQSDIVYRLLDNFTLFVKTEQETAERRREAVLKQEQERALLAVKRERAKEARKEKKRDELEHKTLLKGMKQQRRAASGCLSKEEPQNEGDGDTDVTDVPAPDAPDTLSAPYSDDESETSLSTSDVIASFGHSLNSTLGMEHRNTWKRTLSESSDDDLLSSRHARQPTLALSHDSRGALLRHMRTSAQLTPVVEYEVPAKGTLARNISNVSIASSVPFSPITPRPKPDDVDMESLTI